MIASEFKVNSHYHWSSYPPDPLNVPSLMVDRVTNSAVEYQVKRNDGITNPLIAGYEVFRFGVPMIGEYDNEGSASTWTTVTISPAVPGAQYRITAWALTGKGRRSATPTAEYVTTGEASECDIMYVTLILMCGCRQCRQCLIYIVQYCCFQYMCHKYDS